MLTFFFLILVGDFRSASWGMTMDEVKKSENSNFEQSENWLFLIDTRFPVEGINKAEVRYKFIENQFVLGVYELRNDKSKLERVVQILKEKYGKDPRVESFDYGRKKEIIRDLDYTKITALFIGCPKDDDYICTLNVFYRSKEHECLFNKEIRRSEIKRKEEFEKKYKNL